MHGLSMEIFTDVDEVKETCKNRTIWKSVVSAYLSVKCAVKTTQTNFNSENKYKKKKPALSRVWEANKQKPQNQRSTDVTAAAPSAARVAGRKCAERR
ncbi:hypothetical protein EVAR_66579_1 [Eumeta japonica]|uniref:Uncharacterized protein n=1 Tax=Eumeta variegata TaxID=151549 RepID=A0A4C1Z6Y9_EUMVA|nr:hypothetical protein EVAR_66579_1 [Eumeta japonica]